MVNKFIIKYLFFRLMMNIDLHHPINLATSFFQNKFKPLLSIIQSKIYTLVSHIFAAYYFIFSHGTVNKLATRCYFFNKN